MDGHCQDRVNTTKKHKDGLDISTLQNIQKKTFRTCREVSNDLCQFDAERLEDAALISLYMTSEMNPE